MHTRTHGGLKAADSTATLYRELAQDVRSNRLRCGIAALSVAGFESKLNVEPKSIAFMCVVASILTAEYSRNCAASIRFLKAQQKCKFLKPRSALDEYGDGKVSTTTNCDTMSLRKHHLYGFYVNALHAMLSEQVALETGISAELLVIFCRLTYNCHNLMYNHFAVVLHNLGFIAGHIEEITRAGVNESAFRKICGSHVFSKAESEVKKLQLDTHIVLTKKGAKIWGSKEKLMQQMQDYQNLAIWSCQHVVLWKNRMLLQEQEKDDELPAGWLHYRP